MEITTTAGALLAGLVTSVHCAGMCGPIACGIGTLARSEKERLIAATVYHGARLFSYSLIGAVCGMIGKQPLQWFFDSPAVLLPWALVVGLIFLAFGLGTVPLLWLAQHQFHRLRLKLCPLTMSRLQRGLAFVTALIMAWRLHDTIPLMNQTVSEEKDLPSCCHEE